MICWKLTLASAIFASSAAIAQIPKAETYEAYADDLSSGGEKTGCTLVFGAVVAEYAYRQGKPTFVTGNLSVSTNKDGNMLSGLKIVLRDVSDESGRETAPFAPYRISAVGKSGKSNIGSIVNTAESDTPGGRFSIFYLDDRFFDIIDRMIEKNELLIQYNRRDGGQDMRVAVDLSKGDNPGKGNKVVGRFIDCLGGMAASLKEKR